jgi:hypothetical protein
VAGISLTDIEPFPDPMSEELRLEQYIQSLEEICGHSPYWVEIAERTLTLEDRRILKDRMTVCIETLSQILQRLDK